MVSPNLSPAMQRPAAQAGHVIRPDPARTSATYHARPGGAQVSQATWSGAFNGARVLGVYVGNALYAPPAQATSAAFVAAMALLLAGVATFTEPAPGTYEIAFLDFTAHPLAPYIPDDPDLTMGAFTDTSDAIMSTQVRAGMGLVWYDYQRRIVQAPLPSSILRDYVGTVDRNSILSDEECTRYGVPFGTLVEGQPVRLHRHCGIYLLTTESVVQGDSTFLIRVGNNAGKWAKTSTADNFLVPFGTFMTSVAQSPDYGAQANFTPS